MITEGKKVSAFLQGVTAYCSPVFWLPNEVFACLCIATARLFQNIPAVLPYSKEPQAMDTPTPQTQTLDMTSLLSTLCAYKNGDFTTRMPVDWTGIPGKIADTVNEIIDMAAQTTNEFERVG